MISAIACVALFSSGLQAQQWGVLRGIVRDTSGAPVAGAYVELPGYADRAATTSANGRFSFTGVLEAEVELRVRRLGFQPWQDVVALSARGGTVEISLIPAILQLEAVTVRTEPREPFTARLAGFEARRLRGNGEFLVREQLDQLASSNFLDVLRRVRGIRINTRGNTMWTQVRLRGSDCAPLLVVDGFPATGGEFDYGMLDPTALEGVEIYHGLASVPAEFVTGRSLENCGVIAVWTRVVRQRPAESRSTASAASGDPAVSLDAMISNGSVYTVDRVDMPATLQAGSRLPSYPDALYNSGIGGRVLVEFVVNIYGIVEPATVRVVSTTRPEFSVAVKEAIVHAQFSSPRVGSARVRQLVQLPFVFQPPLPSQGPGVDSGSAGG